MDKSQLEEAEYFAGLLLLDTELDDILELPPGSIERLVEDRDSELGRAIRKGRLKTKCEHLDAVIATARRHSSPAQLMVQDLIKKLDTQ